MKKRIIIVLAAALIFCLFAAGCSSKDDPAVTEAPAVSPTPEPTPEPCVIMGKSYPLNIESIDLRGLNDTLVDETAVQLKRLTKLKTVTLGSWEESPVTWGKMNELHTACPQAAIDYESSIYGKTFNLSDEEMDLKYVSIKDEGRLLKLITACMTNLTFLDMDTAGVSDEKMAELRDSLPNTEVVWRVWFGDAYSVRTDVERILASQPSHGGMLDRYNSEALKYCTDVKYLDVGHNDALDDISFVAYMPKLEVAILAMDNWSDATPLASCTELEYLEMQTTLCTDLSPLSGLKNLRHLDIAYIVDLEDISPLYSLTELERLWVGSNNRVPKEQIEQMRAAAPNCEVNDTVYDDPTGGRWRYVDYNDKAYIFILHPRYEKLREQFGYTSADFSFYWNDPLY